MEWVRIDFFDNESICELIDKQNYGILSLLNEPHITSDDGILLRMQQCCAGHPNFMTTGPSLTSSCFKWVFLGIFQCNKHIFISESDTSPTP